MRGGANWIVRADSYSAAADRKPDDTLLGDWAKAHSAVRNVRVAFPHEALNQNAQPIWLGDKLERQAFTGVKLNLLELVPIKQLYRHPDDAPALPCARA